jgi:hypothetical protein
MNVDFQQLAVALIMLVPGFITTSIQRAFAPRRFASDAHWVVSSLLIALPLNFLAMLPFWVMHLPAAATLRLRDLPESARNVSAGAALTYVLVLYSLALVVGLLVGRFPGLRLRALLNRARVVSFAEHPSVWDRIFDVRRPKDRPTTWLCIRAEHGKLVFGHLRNSSEHIDRQHPFEIYLEQPHEWLYGRWVPMEIDAPLRRKADGVYLRILPAQLVELYFVADGWKP